jgi:predicted permease
MGRILNDLRYAIRILAKNPGITLIVVLSMGLSIGANTTVFTWLESFVLNPTPVVRDSGRLVAVNSANKDGIGDEAEPFSYPTYLDWRDQSQSFEGLLAHISTRLNLRQPNEAQGEPVWGEMVSGNYFDVLGVPAIVGRTFTLNEERDAAHEAVLNYSLWQRRFGADPSVIGKHLLLNGADVTIVGVAPQGFNGVLAAYGFDLWIPLTLQPALSAAKNRVNDRKDRWLQGTGRLKQGVTLAQANEELKVVSRQISEARGDVPITSSQVKLMRERFSGPTFYPMFSLLLGVTGIVLLIACANVANLLLARASSRRKEIAVRFALGATRANIIRQLMIESLLLSIIGGFVGLLFALWAKDSLVLLFPPTPQPELLKIEISGRIISFAFLVTLLTTVIFGLMPAMRASKVDLITVIKQEGRGVSGSRSRIRSALIVAQVAMSVVALVSAGLFLRSLQSARSVDVGFQDPNHLLLVTTDFNVAGFKRENGLVAADQLLERVRAMSGVGSASLSTTVPLGFSGHTYSDTKIEGYVPPPDEQVSIERVVVSDGYFETMGIPLVQGRGITATDRNDAQRVAVVNETFARRYYPDHDPIGKRVDQGQGWAIIVGIAKDGKYRDLDETPAPVVYSSLQQWYVPGVTLHVRASGKANPKLLSEPVRGVFAVINANLPFLDPRTMAEHMSASMFRQFFGASILSVLAALALLIAAVGLYGVLSYVVTQRTGEIAIRMALGATPKDVLGLVLKEGLGMTIVGLVIGSLLSLAVGRLLQSQLLGVGANDPLSFAGMAVVLLGVAMGACFVPARRATKVDPMIALRYE